MDHFLTSLHLVDDLQYQTTNQSFSQILPRIIGITTLRRDQKSSSNGLHFLGWSAMKTTGFIEAMENGP